MQSEHKQGPLTPRAQGDQSPLSNSRDKLKKQAGTLSYEAGSQLLSPDVVSGASSDGVAQRPPMRPTTRPRELTLEEEIEQDATSRSYTHYNKRYDELNGPITDAMAKTKDDDALGEVAAREGRLEAVSQHRRSEAAAYPAHTYKGFHFRHLAMGNEVDPRLSQDAHEARRGDTHPLAQLKGLDIGDGCVWFYKAIKAAQLPAIVSGGLDAKYGGLGGATEAGGENMGAEREAAMAAFKQRDRGKTYVSPGFDNAHGYQKTLKVDSHTVVCRIPLQATSALMFATEGSHDEWITMGTVIPAEYIYVLDASGDVRPDAVTRGGRTFVPVSTFGSQG